MFQENKQLSKLCTFGIGGPAKYFTEVKTAEEMRAALHKCLTERLRYFILGKGSNCLFDDRGFNGAVILNKIDFMHRLPGNCIHVGAGYSFSLLGSQTARQGLSGLEFASGIPGTVGGAVFMNAGANGKETCEALLSVDYMHEDGRLCTLHKHDLHFSYRLSSFHKMPGAIIGASFQLTESNAARERQLEIISYRKKTQPYGDKSAGCIFRNAECSSAGALIDKSGLKGFQIGGAKVSEMHANFIVNCESATTQDVLELINIIRKNVYEKYAIELESEVRYIPCESYEPI